ncbi:hypothetical protein JTE90_005123 [Oedothorax gibbosus]|uniref:Uncharacterized protein n=1 Tax=Oedothorax gibbosus TaxID=931172 RepID=A0AAV6ULY8_9ARAC|nr:hypothetical protein JTE90_005123 [Oedothorax gibbosus]
MMVFISNSFMGGPAAGRDWRSHLFIENGAVNPYLTGTRTRNVVVQRRSKIIRRILKDENGTKDNGNVFFSSFSVFASLC